MRLKPIRKSWHLLGVQPLSINPYQPPRHRTELSDQEETEQQESVSRRSLAATIESFLASEITAFQFDEKLEPFRGSEDPLIRHVAEAAWYHYDDCDDHLVCLDKVEWDYFQRLLLALHSDATVDIKTERRWSVKQLIAASALALFVYLAFQVGWGEHLMILAIPFGAISIALSFWRFETPASNPYEAIIFPFASFADLAAIYRRSDFQKTQFPVHLRQRSIRSPAMSVFWCLHAYVMWTLFSPIPLAIQVLPETQTDTRILAS